MPRGLEHGVRARLSWLRVGRRGGAAALLLVIGAWAVAQDAVVVRIGHVGPRSGPAAHLGLDNVNGVRLALEDLNARGLTLGGRPARFELVAEDDAADPKQGLQVAQKLCDLKVNGVVGHQTSGSALPASRVYHECGLPNIAPVATHPKLTQQGYRTSFRVLASDTLTGAALALKAADELKLKRVAIVDDRSAYGQGLADAFARVAKAKGIELVGHHSTHDKAVDFSALLTAVKAAHAQAIFYGGLDAQAGPMLRQMQQLGMAEVRLLGGDGICTTQLAELAGAVAVLGKVLCAEGGVAIETVPGGPAWRARYEQRFAGQYQGSAPYSYDATLALAEAMRLADSADPQVYGPKLFEIKAPGLTGLLAFDAQGERRTPTLSFARFVDGKKVAWSRGTR